MRAIDRDLIRGGHYGQRPRVPHTQAEHMGAPTNAANVKKVLANSEPSTHGGKADMPLCGANVRYWHLADNPTAPAFVRYWSNSGQQRLETCHRTARRVAATVTSSGCIRVAFW